MSTFLPVSATELDGDLAASLKKSWCESERMRQSDHRVSIQRNLKQALVSLYLSQQKELKADWLSQASLADISSSVKKQADGKETDFPEIFTGCFARAKRLPDGGFEFLVRTGGCGRSQIVRPKSEKYVICKRALRSMPNNFEYHNLPKTFPDQILF